MVLDLAALANGALRGEPSQETLGMDGAAPCLGWVDPGPALLVHSPPQPLQAAAARAWEPRAWQYSKA